MNQENQREEQYIVNEQKLYNELSQALQVLSKISPSSPQVKTSNQLIIRSLTQPQTLPILLKLLIQSQSNPVHSSLLISFIAYYLKIQVRPGIKIARHDKRAIYQKVKGVFYCATVTNRSKKMLVGAFGEFLATLAPEFIRIRKSLCQEIVGGFMSQGQITVNDVSNVTYLIEAVLTPSLESESLKILEENLLANFIKLSLEQIRELSTILPTATTNKLSPQNHLKLDWSLKIHKIASLLFTNASIQKLSSLKNTTILSPNLANLCLLSLKLSPDGNSFIINSGQLQEFQQLNEIKIETMKIVEDLLRVLIKGKNNLAGSKFVPVQETIKGLLGVVSVVAGEVGAYPKKPLACPELLKRFMLVLSKITAIPMFLNELTQLRDTVIFRICLPCLMPTPQDKHLAAQDFCQKRQKIINFEQPQNIHQASSTLLESYSNEIYGTVPHLIKSLLNLIEFQLTADPRHFQLIPPILVESEFYKGSSYFEQIQIALAVLALLSYHAETRDDIAGTVEEFLVRRQEFFSRIDVPENLIVSFLNFCSYYLENFYLLILQGKANANFHRSLLLHSLQLLTASFNPQTRSYLNNSTKKIGIQALDYISNAMIQPHFFSAVFPAWNPESTPALVGFVDKLCGFFDSTANISVIETVLIDFVTRCMDRHFKDQGNLLGMPLVLRKQLAELLAHKIIENFKSTIKNQTIAKQKMLQLYSLLFLFSDSPLTLLEISSPLITHIVQTEYSLIDEALDLVQVFMKRAVKQNIVLSPLLQRVVANCVVKSMRICDNQRYETEVFDVVLGLGLRGVHQQEIADCLIENFQDRLEDIDTDEEAELMMEKTLYLLLQIAFSNFNLVSPSTWLKIFERMIEYMRTHYKRQDTITIGKATCICLCIYIQDPQGIQSYLQTRVEGLWDIILDDQLKYSSQTQKKIVCLLLLNFLIKFSHRPIIKDKFPSILRTVCIIMYYIYEKSQLSWKSEESEDEDNESKSLVQDVKPWREPFSTMRENKFLSDLPDERVILRDICNKLKETDLQNFERFLNDLPMGIQNLVKNKIMMYRGEPALANKKKIRTIFKIKKEQESGQQ